MSLLSSHRLHWGSHHELTDHFWIIVDHLVHPTTPGTTAPQATDRPPEGTPPAADPVPPDDTRLDALGP